MKTFTMTLAALICLCQCAFAQQGENAGGVAAYDSSLARRLGADDYGMKKYVMAFLKSGSVKIEDSAKRAELQRLHLQNIIRLAREGTLIVAGPFLDDQAMRGIFIFNVGTVEEARAIAESDPAVRAGTLQLELHPWYGSAALMETVRIHHTLEKKSVAD
jgi:uncharacterized protein YciI